VFQHIDYAHQVALKKDILQDDLRRIGGYTGPVQTVEESPPYHNRIRARMKGYDDGRTGFIRKGTNTVLPIGGCLLFPDAINQFLEKWNTLQEPPFFHQLDIFFNSQDKNLYVYLSHPPKEPVKKVLASFPGVIFSWKGKEDAGVSSLTVRGNTYYVSPEVFFQVNPYQWENMLDAVEGFLEDSTRIIDLYCGVGFFIPLLSAHAREVIGVEHYGFSVELAQRAFPGAEFFKSPSEKFYFPDADILVVDPPRSGLSRHVMKRIVSGKYGKLIYISCSSATFARDLKELVENRYKVEDLKAFDLFPQTSHLETIACLVRQG
jgi:23S rRNA (uracil1939-C5)-methyltransferase